MPVAALRQRSEYTHKYNVRSGRHGWLRLTPAYSVKIVEEILAHVPGPARVLDPFSGTATTALCAASRGHDVTTTEINPFLVWFGRAKTARYTPSQVSTAQNAAAAALAEVACGSTEPIPPPPLHNIERWWKPDGLRFLCSLKGAIELCVRGNPVSRTLLMVAFCRTLIRLSNAAFNHQSMSFRDDDYNLALFDHESSDRLRADGFLEDVRYVLNSALDNPAGRAAVVHGDACKIEKLVPRLHDVVVTSPPYPNRMSYIRELRPYMYWLGFLKDPRGAAELDWASIGGTWGAATSRLSEWRRADSGFRPPYFSEVIERIADKRHTSGPLLSNYVSKYFEDMFRHLTSLRKVLSPDARVHYVVGNSTFYGVLVPVERLYADMLACLGFSEISVTPLRKRNSKKELVEYDVSACWRG